MDELFDDIDRKVVISRVRCRSSTGLREGSLVLNPEEFQSLAQILILAMVKTMSPRFVKRRHPFCSNFVRLNLIKTGPFSGYAELCDRSAFRFVRSG